ncbi:MAG: phage tail protein [Oscillochloris sp.]|nr:phage tail protein [Oscillochloris sp.]
MPAEPLLAEIYMFAGNFAPRGYAFCQGQLLAISSNTALFSLLGTTYGGNGQTTFALPDLRGRVPVGTGQGPGLSNVVLGEMSGAMSTTLTINNMPIHAHTATATVNAVSGTGNTSGPANALPAGSSARDNQYSTAGGNTTMAAGMVGVTVNQAGGSQPFNIMQPYLGMNFVIALEGIYPSRN